jgi:Carboxypeptidase regulatory-like domain
MCLNLLVRSLCGAFALPVLVAIIGHAQAPNLPTGEGRISGRILTSMSEPIADATVLLGLSASGVVVESRAWWVATSDLNGLYQFTDLPAGRFVVVATKNGYVGWESIPTASPLAAARSFPALALAMRAPQFALDLVPGGRASEVNLTMHRPASISGRAVRPDGSPAIEERVMLYTADETGVITSSRGGLPTDANGAYSFSDLRPGTYYFGVSQPGRLQDLDRSTLTPGTVTEGMSLRNVDVFIITDRVFSVAGRVTDVLGQVPRPLQLEYGVPGSTHRGLLSVSSPDGRFHIRDRGIVPGPLTIIARGENDDGPMIGLLTFTTIDGPNDVEIIIGKPGGLRGRVSMERGVPQTPVGLRLTLVREGFSPFSALDDVIEIAADGSFETGNLIGEYRVRVDEPRQWTVKAVRRSGIRVANDRLVVRSAEILDELEILIGSR